MVPSSCVWENCCIISGNNKIKAIGLPNPPLPKTPAALIWGPSWAVLETLLEHHCGAGLPGQGTGEN